MQLITISASAPQTAQWKAACVFISTHFICPFSNIEYPQFTNSSSAQMYSGGLHNMPHCLSFRADVFRFPLRWQLLHGQSSCDYTPSCVSDYTCLPPTSVTQGAKKLPWILQKTPLPPDFQAQTFLGLARVSEELTSPLKSPVHCSRLH